VFSNSSNELSNEKDFRIEAPFNSTRIKKLARTGVITKRLMLV